MLEQAYQGGQSQSADRIDRILSLVERFKKIDDAIDKIRYDHDLVTEIPEVLKALGAAKDAVIAELKTI